MNTDSQPATATTSTSTCRYTILNLQKQKNGKILLKTCKKILKITNNNRTNSTNRNNQNREKSSQKKKKTIKATHIATFKCLITFALKSSF